MERKLKGWKYRTIKGVNVVPSITLVLDVMWNGEWRKFHCYVLEVKSWSEDGCKVVGVKMANSEGHEIYREYWGETKVTKAIAYYEV